MPPPITIPPHVVHEDIDGEVIILHLKDGLYHTLNDSAGLIWRCIADGSAPEEIAAEFLEQYQIEDIDRAKALVARMLAMMVAEKLVETNDRLPEWAVEVSLDDSADEADPAYPVIHTYRDMQAALVLDPVHDVDHRTGWPNPKTDEPESKAE